MKVGADMLRIKTTDTCHPKIPTAPKVVATINMALQEADVRRTAKRGLTTRRYRAAMRGETDEA